MAMPVVITLVTSTLFPWKSVKTPAADSAALVSLVEFAFEAFVDMENMLQASLGQCAAGLFRALAAAADQDHRGATLIHDTDRPPKQQFSDIGHEVGIFHPIRLVDPGYISPAEREATTE